MFGLTTVLYYKGVDLDSSHRFANIGLDLTLDIGLEPFDLEEHTFPN